MPEERLSISSSARVHPDEVARHTFGTQRRGFDPAEVRSFLEHVARELVAAADREQELRRALSEAEKRAANPVLDESTLTAALGLETARVLRSAHEAAAELVGRAENDAARLRAQAQEDAEQLQRHTEQNVHDRSAEADAAVTELRRPRPGGGRAPGWKAPSSKPRLWSPRRGPSAAPWCKRRRSCEPGCSPTWPVVDGCCTARSSSSGRDASAWPRRSGTSVIAVDHITDELFRAEDEARLAAEAAGRQAAQGELSEADHRDRRGGFPGASCASGDDPDTEAVGGGALRPPAGRGRCGGGPRRRPRRRLGGGDRRRTGLGRARP